MRKSGNTEEYLMTNISRTLYRISSWLEHRLRAWNTGGEGIHSPYLFEWVRMVMYDTHLYYIWHEIEQQRQAMLHAPKLVQYVDYGSGGKTLPMTDNDKSEPSISQRFVSDVAATSLEPKKFGQLLFRLVNWRGHQVREEEQRGLNIVELGTSLGITTAYLASPDSRNHITTFEGCPDVADIARKIWNKLQIKNIDCIVGNIDDTLPTADLGQIDIAFIDANHTQEATLWYFDILMQHIDRKSIIVVDDIYYSREMHEAWMQICNHPQVTTTMDLYKMGLVFFSPSYLRKHYKLRV